MLRKERKYRTVYLWHKNEVTFAGSITDKSTGLQYMNARFYNPATGRFITQDTYKGNSFNTVLAFIIKTSSILTLSYRHTIHLKSSATKGLFVTLLQLSVMIDRLDIVVIFKQINHFFKLLGLCFV
ncbi:MAG: RHS repeat-associated core domain-containing protein [Christensenellaceae bacterium]